MVDATERLLEQADDLRGLGAHYAEQGRERDAQICTIVELSLRLVAEALDEENDDE